LSKNKPIFPKTQATKNPRSSDKSTSMSSKASMKNRTVIWEDCIYRISKKCSIF